MKILYTSYYKAYDNARQSELKHCMLKNIENPHIEKIIVLLEGNAREFPELLGIPKVKIVEAPRPTFQDFFDIANILSGDEDYSIITNSDIYFDETIDRLTGFNMHNMCFALSRWHFHNPSKIELHNEKFSQDVWIFQGKIKPIGYAHFVMGHPGCDNRIAWELETAGYNMFNPAFDIKCIHYHMSESRNYPSGKVPKPYLPVPLGNMPQPNGNQFPRSKRNITW